MPPVIIFLSDLLDCVELPLIYLGSIITSDPQPTAFQACSIRHLTSKQQSDII